MCSFQTPPNTEICTTNLGVFQMIELIKWLFIEIQFESFFKKKLQILNHKCKLAIVFQFLETTVVCKNQ